MTYTQGRGFTIVELTIATAIFSTVLLVGLTSFLGVSKLYYKSLALTQTQSVAQQIISQVTGDIQFASTIATGYPSSVGLFTDGGSQYVCFGNIRYTFFLFNEVNLDDHDNQTKFGLLRDSLLGSTGCAPPFGAGAVGLNNPVELLGNKMRLSQFDIVPAKDDAGDKVNNLWDVNIKVAYGDNEFLDNAAAQNATCKPNLSSSQFCSVSSQTTTVTRGL